MQKLHEEPRRLYRNKAAGKSIRKNVRCCINNSTVSSDNTNNCEGSQSTCNRSGTPTNLPLKSHPTDVTSIRLAQSPFHHLQLHNQQQQMQIKLQLEQHLLQQRIRQQQLEQVIQLDSPDHIDTPDHLSSPDLTSALDSPLTNLINAPEQYSYLPPSPSLSPR